MVRDGKFREDLFYRLSVFELHLPPLRDRGDDLTLLTEFFLDHFRRLHGRPTLMLTDTARARLREYHWPGNVRQLRNVVRQIAVAGCDAGAEGMWAQVESALREAVKAPDSSVETRPSSSSQATKKAARKPYRNPEEISEEELIAALRAHRWRLQAAADQLGLSRPSLYAKIDRSPNIRKAADLSRQEIEACYAQWGGDLDAMAEALEVSKRGLQLRMGQLGLRS